MTLQRKPRAHMNDEITCCGIRELYGLSQHTLPTFDYTTRNYSEKHRLLSVEELVATVKEQSPRFCMVLFSDQVTKDSQGAKLAAYIKEKSLGDVVETPVKTNPNSGHKIQAWIWVLNRSNLNSWYSAWKKDNPNA